MKESSVEEFGDDVTEEVVEETVKHNYIHIN